MDLSLKWADAVVLIVGDLERSREFYTKSLGMALGGEDKDAAVFKTESGGMLILLSHHRADALLGADNVDHGVGRVDEPVVAGVRLRHIIDRANVA